ncbi:MAG: hypothetical protein JXA37_02115 [Chloroflexia bacterium]|nr:hypothetical protein [Chloroflexia bacterium]
MPKDDFWIRASDVQAFAYCARSWWLREILGLEPADPGRLQAGVERHAEVGRQVVRAGLGQRLGWLFLGVALLLFLLAWLLGGG